MGNTIAIHWSATTHGTWLHGDPRGSWRDGRLVGPDPYLEAESRARMVGNAVLLDAIERAVVVKEFGNVVREQRHRVFAACIQTTHVHLVLAPLREDIKTVIARFKRRSAGAVLAPRREALAASGGSGRGGVTGQDGRAISVTGQDGRAKLHGGRDGRAIWVPRSLWTAGRFPVFVFDERHLVNAIEYIRDHNRRLGFPADPFDWIDPLYPAGKLAGERYCRSDVCERVWM